MEKPPALKINILDTLRGFAAISVCLFHFVYSTVDFVKADWIRNIFFQGIYGVQTFFVISGFIIPYAMYQSRYKLQNFFSFFLKRLARLEPPYLFSIVLALVILFLRARYFGKVNSVDVSFKQVALHFGYLIPFFKDYQWLNEVYWTLAVEFQFYLFIALAYIPIVRSGLLIRVFIYGAILLASAFGSYTFLPNALPFFLLGILVFLLKTNTITPKEYYITTCIAVIFVFFNYKVGALIFGLVPVCLIIYFEDMRFGFLDCLGKFSYSIYLVHPLIGSSIINILSHHVNSPLEKAGVVILGLIATLAVAKSTYWLIERPSQKLSRSIVYE